MYDKSEPEKCDKYIPPICAAMGIESTSGANPQR